MYGSLTTKELKKKHFSRWVGQAETGSRGLMARQQLEDQERLKDQGRWQLAEQVVPHLRVDKLGETSGERDRPSTPGF